MIFRPQIRSFFIHGNFINYLQTKNKYNATIQFISLGSSRHVLLKVSVTSLHDLAPLLRCGSTPTGNARTTGSSQQEHWQHKHTGSNICWWSQSSFGAQHAELIYNTRMCDHIHLDALYGYISHFLTVDVKPNKIYCACSLC